MTKLVLTGAALISVAGCIPQATSDYRIGSPPPRASQDSPQIIPERGAVLKTPNWQPAVVDRNSRAAIAGEYTVTAGDTLFGISSKTGASLTDIAEANNLQTPYILRVGQRLEIPSGLYHTVNSGETGIAIARAYGVSWNNVVALNRLEVPFILQVGQRLRLPDNSVKELPDDSRSPEQRAASFSLDIDDIVTGGEPAIAVSFPPAAAPVHAPVSLASPIARPASFAGSFDWPVLGKMVSSFGSKGGGVQNDGIAIGADEGTAVAAAGNGMVVYAGNEIEVFGGLVLIDHGSGWVTAYGHLGQLNVARGDKVRTGQKLGTVGDTGYVDSPQLHFEIRKDRKPLNPITKLPVRG